MATYNGKNKNYWTSKEYYVKTHTLNESKSFTLQLYIYNKLQSKNNKLLKAR